MEAGCTRCDASLFCEGTKKCGVREVRQFVVAESHGVLCEGATLGRLWQCWQSRGEEALGIADWHCRTGSCGLAAAQQSPGRRLKVIHINSPQPGSNRRPVGYKPNALPLSHGGRLHTLRSELLLCRNKIGVLSRSATVPCCGGPWPFGEGATLGRVCQCWQRSGERSTGHCRRAQTQWPQWSGCGSPITRQAPAGGVYG